METSESAKPARRSYTPEQREVILSEAEALGVCAAARKHGIPQPTISGWRRVAKANGSSTASVARAAEQEQVIGDEASDATAAKTTAAKTTATKADTRPARRYTPSEKAQVLEHAA